MTGWGNAVGLDKFPWTDISRARVKALWAEGVSALHIAAAISAEFFHKVERNAVIGIVHRGKFESPMSKKNLRVQAGHSARSNLAPRPGGPRKPAVKRDGPELPDISLPAAEGDSLLAFGRAVPLLRLDDNGCKWPIGDRDFVFCNAAQVDGLPYCVAHCRCAYRPSLGSSLAR